MIRKLLSLLLALAEQSQSASDISAIELRDVHLSKFKKLQTKVCTKSVAGVQFIATHNTLSFI